MNSKQSKEKLMHWMALNEIPKDKSLELVNNFFEETCKKRIPSNWSLDRIEKWKWNYVMQNIKEFEITVGVYLQMKNMVANKKVN